jgi:hypothetical protein
MAPGPVIWLVLILLCLLVFLISRLSVTPHKWAQFGHTVRHHLDALPKWQNQPQILYQQFPYRPWQKSLDDLDLFAEFVPLVICGHKHNQSILDEYVPVLILILTITLTLLNSRALF